MTDPIRTERSMRTKNGFTLLELILVIGILAILASIILLAANPTLRLREAKLRAGDKQAREIQSAINQYIIENLEPPNGITDEPQVICSDGFLPTGSGCAITLENFLANKTDMDKAYIHKIPQHPWFTEPNSGYRVFSDSGRFFVKPIPVEFDIVLVLDQSTSMKFSVDSPETGMSINDRRFCRAPNSSSRWVAVNNAVRLFANILSTNSAAENLSIVTFASDLNTVNPGLCGRRPNASIEQDFDDDLGSATRTMDRLTTAVWNGNTEIAAGVDLAVSQLTGPTSRKNVEKFIVLLTDGYPTAGDTVSAATNAAAQGITVYVITFGPIEGVNGTLMQEVANAGGGEYSHAPNEATLKQIFARFADKTEDY